MASARLFAAVDLGAESGRVVLGRLDGDRRARGRAPVRQPSRVAARRPALEHLALFAETLEGLGARGRASGRLDGVGVDAWGVDYALLDGDHRCSACPSTTATARNDG